MNRPLFILVVIAFSSLCYVMRAQTPQKDTIDASIISSSKRAFYGAKLVPSSDYITTFSPLGDNSAITFIQSLPGVSSGTEGSSAYFVRGGNLGGNLITIDGVPIYGSGHILGFTTTYPQDIVKETHFFAGGFSSEEGNLTSSHIMISSKDGDFKEFAGKVSASPFLIGASSSGPMIRNKLSFIGSLRFSPIGYELNGIKNMTEAMDSITGIKAIVYDFYGKLKWKINDKQNLSFSVFNSLDSYCYNQGHVSNDNMGWGNLVASLSYNITPGVRWKITNALDFNHFQNHQIMEKTLGEQENKIHLHSGLSETSIRSLALWTGGKGWNIQSGFKMRMASFNSGVANISSKRLFAVAHGQIDKKKNGKYNLRLSTRINSFSSIGQTGNVRMRRSVDPEYSLFGRMYLTKWLGAEVSADKTRQYYHVLEGLPLGWSLDMIVPADNDVLPEKASQQYVGLFVSGKTHHLSIGVYKKKTDNLVFFEDATQIFSQAILGWKEIICTGSGFSKGLELLYEFDSKIVGAKISYTLSKTDRVFPEINEGNPFPAKFDRRHILNAQFKWLISKSETREIGVTSFFTYQSGHWETIPAGHYIGWISPKEAVIIDYNTMIHNWQTPPYIRCDIGAFWHYGNNTKNPGTINVGIYNLFNRHNINNISFDPLNRKWKSLSIFPIMPTISWTMDF